MSWRWSLREIERNLEINGIADNADARRKKAREIFDIMKKGLFEGLRSVPEILFVTAAGNEGDDVSFDEVIPASLDLPNLLAVGAVDQGGEETTFTSSGNLVSVYANGFEVESFLPGGEKMVMSGTSMAAPHVSNLAAKLLAINDSLNTNQLTTLIRDGADKTIDGRLALINPKRSVELLRRRP